MKNIHPLRYTACLISLFFSLAAPGQKPTDSLTRQLLGRWEVVAYSEQGVQVNKKTAALPQALQVYEHQRRQRAERWYGISDYEDLSRRENRAFERWLERDSSIEVRRVAEAIAMPYYVVFFPDSTLALYNKDETTQRVYFPEARRYVFAPATQSLDIFLPGGFGIQWQAQLLLLSAERMVLFLPEEAEVVELFKTTHDLP